MRLRMLLIMVIAVMAFSLLATSSAFAQNLPCTSVNLTLVPTHGVAGTSVMATGGNLMGNTETEFYWDTIDAPGFLGQVLSSDPGGDFSFSFNVPAGATAGVHQVTVRGLFGNETLVDCSADFTVDATVQTDAYTPALAAQGETPSVLPSTGLMLLVPAAGLASGAVGAAMLRRRRQ